MEPNNDLRTPPALKIVKGLNVDYKSPSLFLTSGIIFTVLGVLFILILGAPSMGGVVAMGILFITRSMHMPIKFREDHLIYKAAPLTKTLKIDYSDITSIDYQKQRLILHCGEKEVKIISNVSTEDWKAVVETFHKIEKA